MSSLGVVLDGIAPDQQLTKSPENASQFPSLFVNDIKNKQKNNEIPIETPFLSPTSFLCDLLFADIPLLLDGFLDASEDLQWNASNFQYSIVSVIDGNEQCSLCLSIYRSVPNPNDPLRSSFVIELCHQRGEYVVFDDIFQEIRQLLQPPRCLVSRMRLSETENCRCTKSSMSTYGCSKENACHANTEIARLC
jgi:hypothetical protein